MADTGAMPLSSAASRLYTPSQTWSYEYDTDVRACTDYDDDEVETWNCAAADEAAWCAKDWLTGNGTVFGGLCAAACTTANATYAMVCAWEAVSRLDEVCARAFVATPPDDGDSRNANNTYWRDYPGRELDLFACDEHAFCHACAAGNAYCEAVAYHYGGVGVPYWVASGVTYTYSSGGNIGERGVRSARPPRRG